MISGHLSISLPNPVTTVGLPSPPLVVDLVADEVAATNRALTSEPIL